MHVHVSSHLHAYTHGENKLEAHGENLAELFRNLDSRYPGIRFRFIDEQGKVREHFRIFVNGDACSDLSKPLKASDQVHVLAALSGG